MASSVAVAVATAPVQFHDYLLYPVDDEKPPIPDLSKYRTSQISSASHKTFEVYADTPTDGTHLAEGDCYPRLDSSTLSTKTLRHRSKSVTSLITLRRERRNIISPPLPASPSPAVSVSVGNLNRGVEFFKGLAESVTGVIGSFSPRTAVGTVDTDNGSTRRRQGSLSSGPQVVRSPVPSVLVSPCAQSFARASSNLNLNLASDSQTAPSPAVPPGPSSPLASPLYVLTPKTTNIPPSLSSLASKPLPLRSPTFNHEYFQNLAQLTGRDRSRSPSQSPSRSRSRPRGADFFKPLPPTSSFDLPPPDSPILRTVPSASDIARFKSRNLLALRINTETAERAAKLEREEQERQEQEAERLADEVARLEAETDRILAEQKKRDLARIHAQLPTPSLRFPRLFVLDKLPFLYRSKRSNAVTSQAGTPSPGAPNIFSLDFSRSNSPEESSSPDKMSFIEQGGKGIVPGTDAPTSAINGGERRVCVRCLSSVINLPVNADTSPVDIIYSTANLTSHDIDPKASVLIECYVELGLERRLRRYERIRDVMNSWDRDQQNSLLVVTNDISQSNDSDLDFKSVPRTPTPPPGFTLQMYHSSRPGKWNKRWITLLESGQMFASKKPDSKVSDKDSTVLCHLSDFDIYTPRESEARRHLKAPRRFCYAVKSQQKTFVFPNGENFVHFFCAEDGQIARRFLELVQRWRSWYLVNKQVDFEKKENKTPQISMGLDSRKSPKAMSRSKSTAAKGHSTQVSVDETPYTIGAFQPLLDMDRFDKPLEEFGKDSNQQKNKDEPDSDPEFKTGLVRKATCKQPNVLSKSKSVHHKHISPAEENQFSPAGLLGQGYEEKRKIAERAPVISPVTTNAAFTKGASLLGQGYEQKRKISERTPVNNSVPSTNAAFTDGPSLLNGGVLSPTTPRENMTDSKSWFPLGTDQSARPSYRSRSVRDTTRRPVADNVPDMPQPLVNLTNSFPEPPRWRENKGHGVKAPTGGPLISLATGGQSNNMFGTRSTSGLVNQSRVPPSSSTMTVGSRPRSRSTAGMQQPPSHAPPVPPVPIRSLRREMTAPVDQSRGRDPRPREPLINRAGTVGNSSRV